MTWQALEEHMREISSRERGEYPIAFDEVVLVLHDEWDWPISRIASALGVDHAPVSAAISRHYEARRRAAHPGYMKVWRPAA